MTSKSPDHRPLCVTLPIRIKTYDIDFVGHVNNIVYVRWLEDLRLQLLDEYAPLDELRAAGTVPIVVNTNIHYRRAISLSDRDVHAQMWVHDFRLAIFHLSAEFSVGGEVRCTARQRGTFINTETGKPVRVPEQLRRHFPAAPDPAAP